MNFSLLYPLFLHILVTSNDRLCYFICHYHVLVSSSLSYFVPLAIIVVYVVHVITETVTISLVIHYSGRDFFVLCAPLPTQLFLLIIMT